MKFLLFIPLIILLFTQCTSKTTSENMEQSPTYGLHGQLTAKSGQGQALAKILLDAAALMKNVQGCHLYMVSLEETNPNNVVITEIWDSKADHDNSLNLPGVQELIGQAMPLLDGAPQKGQGLKILGGLGVNK